MAEAATSRDPAREVKPPSLDLLVAQLCSAHGYPALAPQIVTGEIVAPVFWMLARQFGRVLALQRVQGMRAVGVAIGAAMSGDTTVADRELREAYPNG